MISYTKIVLVHGTAATSYKMAEKQKPVSAVFKHFDLPPSTDGHFKAKCKYCTKELSGTTKFTTNWWKHLVSVV